MDEQGNESKDIVSETEFVSCFPNQCKKEFSTNTDAPQKQDRSVSPDLSLLAAMCVDVGVQITPRAAPLEPTNEPTAKEKKNSC